MVAKVYKDLSLYKVRGKKKTVSYLCMELSPSLAESEVSDMVDSSFFLQENQCCTHIKFQSQRKNLDWRTA